MLISVFLMFDFLKLKIQEISPEPIRFRETTNLAQCRFPQSKDKKEAYKHKSVPISICRDNRIDTKKKNMYENLRKLKNSSQPKLKVQQQKQQKLVSYRQAVQSFCHYINNFNHQQIAYRKYYTIIKSQKVQLCELERYFLDFSHSLNVFQEEDQIIDLYQEMLKQLQVPQDGEYVLDNLQNIQKSRWKETVEGFIIAYYQQNLLNAQTCSRIETTQKFINEQKTNLSQYFQQFNNNKNTYLLQKIPKDINIFESERLIQNLLQISRDAYRQRYSNRVINNFTTNNITNKLLKSDKNQQTEELMKWTNLFGHFLFQI